jgi:signal transduction histidine kinase
MPFVSTKKAKGLSRLILLAALSSLFFSGTAYAEVLPIKNYTSAEGLIYESVIRIYQDSRGFLWFCTNVGVSRFDGYQFTSYAMQDGLPNPTITDIIEDDNGIFWLGTNASGVYRFDPRRKAADENSSKPVFDSFTIDDDKNSNAATRFFKTRRGEIYLATEGGLYRLHDEEKEKKFRRVALNPPSAPNQSFAVTALAEDAGGDSLWIGHQFGLSRLLPDGGLIHYEVQPGGGTDWIRSLAFDRENRLWMITNNRSVAVFNPEPAAAINGSGETKRSIRFTLEGNIQIDLKQGFARIFNASESLADGSFSEICPTSDGKIWLSALGRGLVEFDGGEFRLYTKENGLSDNRILSLREDGFGNLWIGSAWGAMKLSQRGFVTYRLADGLASEAVLSIFQDRAGALYAVNAGWKINRFDGRQFVSVTPNLPSEAGSWRYHHVLVDSAGDWWISTRKGLFKFSAVEKIEQLAAAKPAAVFNASQNGLPNDDVFALFEDSRGDVWFSYWQNTLARVSRWERATGELHHYSAENGIPEQCFASYFREDAAGNVFIGCREQSVVVYHQGRFSSFAAVGETADKTIHDILIDRRGRLWVALAVGGLNRIDQPLKTDSAIASYDTAQGLSSNHIQYLAEDNAGRIYAVTSRGMDRINTETREIKHYTIADGLAAAGTGAAVRDKTGALWLGTARGVSKFVPEAETNLNAPQVFIGGLKIAGKEIALSALGETEIGNLTLAPDERQIQIDFYGLNLASGEALRYQYKLEGAGGDWSEPSNQRTISLNVAPGSYRFLVRAVNSDGLPSASPATVSFTILRPVWQRWWFLALAALAVGAGIFALDRYRAQKTRQVQTALEALNESRKERLVELERVRARIATDLHDDIGSSLSQIAVLSEVAQSGGANNHDSASEPLRQISTVSNELVEAMSDIVWAINPRRDNLRDLVQRMRRFVSDVFTAKNIAFEFIAPDFDENVQIGANIRREVFVIFKECVNNIVRHSGAKKAKIKLEIDEGKLRMEINDDGRGFEPARIFAENFSPGKGGNGVLNIHQRARELNADCELISAPGKGTIVKLEFPIQSQSAENNFAALTQAGSESSGDSR